MENFFLSFLNIEKFCSNFEHTIQAVIALTTVYLAWIATRTPAPKIQGKISLLGKSFPSEDNLAEGIQIEVRNSSGVSVVVHPNTIYFKTYKQYKWLPTWLRNRSAWIKRGLDEKQHKITLKGIVGDKRNFSEEKIYAIAPNSTEVFEAIYNIDNNSAFYHIQAFLILLIASLLNCILTTF